MIKKFILNCLILNNIALLANRDCLDNSKHTDIFCGYDYKRYIPVKNCYCPCQRYPILFARGKCTKCGHYRALKLK